jgi:hypothetical protein
VSVIAIFRQLALGHAVKSSHIEIADEHR